MTQQHIWPRLARVNNVDRGGKKVKKQMEYIEFHTDLIFDILF